MASKFSERASRATDSAGTKYVKQERPAISGLEEKLMRSAYGDLSDLEEQLKPYGVVSMGSEMEYYLMPDGKPTNVDLEGLKAERRKELTVKLRETLVQIGVPEDKVDGTPVLKRSATLVISECCYGKTICSPFPR
ncbi:MAG: hypothetical protein EBV03_06170 [Proteobacteria bacterium]|nr:hypothetical protein [Pseudomonadota bacterium]